jgi:hypothetical protein
MSEKGHERLGGASCRSSNVRNAPLATVGLKKAACREGPKGDMRSAACDFGSGRSAKVEKHLSTPLGVKNRFAQ